MKRWLNKPPKKYRFKRGKVKHPKFLSISGPSEALDLTTPKIIEIISSSLFQVAGLREHVSLKKIGEIIIQTCGKKLSSDFRLKLVKNFAPIMLEDLEKMKLIPEKELKEELEMDSLIGIDEPEMPEEKREYKAYSHESPDGEKIKALFDLINSFQDEDLEFKYFMFTEQAVKDNIEDTLEGGKKLDDERHSELMKLYPALAVKYRYLFDFASEVFYFSGEELWSSDEEQAEYNYYRAMAIILLLSEGSQVTFEELYRGVTGTYSEEKARGIIQRWFTDLKNLLRVKKKDLNRIFLSWKGKGYKVVKKDEFKFLLVLDEEMFQNIMKFSQL